MNIVSSLQTFLQRVCCMQYSSQNSKIFHQFSKLLEFFSLFFLKAQPFSLKFKNLPFSTSEILLLSSNPPPVTSYIFKSYPSTFCTRSCEPLLLITNCVLLTLNDSSKRVLIYKPLSLRLAHHRAAKGKVEEEC